MHASVLCTQASNVVSAILQIYTVSRDLFQAHAEEFTETLQKQTEMTEPALLSIIQICQNEHVYGKLHLGLLNIAPPSFHGRCCIAAENRLTPTFSVNNEAGGSDNRRKQTTSIRRDGHCLCCALSVSFLKQDPLELGSQV